MIGCVRTLVGLALAICLAGCVHGAESQACIDPLSETIFVTVTNDSDVSISVPKNRPHIGCCNAATISIAVTNENGVEIERCGTSDNFEIPTEVQLQPSESIRYELSEVSVRGVYCGVDLTKYFIKTSFGRPDSEQLQISQKIEEIKMCSYSSDQQQR